MEMTKERNLKKRTWRSYLVAALVLFMACGLGFAMFGQSVEAKTSSSPQMIPASFQQVAEQASPAVVNISTERKVEGANFNGLPNFPGGNDEFRQFFEHFFGGRGQMRPQKQHALGTGFIIDPQGLVITNNHVIDGADEIMVRLNDEKEYEATVLGRDPKTDLALIKINADQKFPYLELGDSKDVGIGDWVVAIGNPFGLSHTVTAGILSARGRVIGAGPYDDFLQTDASINPGNSGGPLLNLSGQVIGINTAIVQGGQGIGFAIPANMAKGILTQLKTHGKVVRGWLGVMIQSVTPEMAKAFKLDDDKGALVADVTPDGPADKAGMKRGDVIVAFNGQTIKDSNELPGVVAITEVGSRADVKIIRDGHEKEITVKIGELEDQTVVASAEENKDLGLTLREMTPELAQKLGIEETKGLVITDVEGNAADSGLKPGDLIVEINHIAVKDIHDYRRLTHNAKEGQSILFLVKRGANTLFFTLEA